MAWICGSHKDAKGDVIPTVIADGSSCPVCFPPVELIKTPKGSTMEIPYTVKRGTVGKSWTTAEAAAQVAADEARKAAIP